jgi:hypothetical protein
VSAPRTDRLGRSGPPQGATLREARLGGVDGVGTLQILRDGSGAYVSTEGTWRPSREDADLEKLANAAERGDTVRFEGVLDDPSKPEAEQVTVDVAIRSHGRYRYESDSDLDGDPVEAGEKRDVFNFEPVDDEVGATS